VIALIAAVTVAGHRVDAQTEPAFEVASVKPNHNLDGGGLMGVGGRFTATNIALRDLIAYAYKIPQYRLVGDVQGLDDRYDIAAKQPDGARASDIPAMLRTLLVDRFKLRAHFESRERPVYNLRFASSDRRFGPKMAASSVDCASIRASRVVTNLTKAPQALDDTSPCYMTMRAGRMTLHDMPVEMFISQVSALLNQVVNDKTDIRGNVTIDLRYADDLTGRTQSDAPSIFTAVEEQLGLKLDSRRAPVEMLVIDSVQRPTSD
jgi:uncharacterized protein (TIGR03435 family)